MLNKVKQCWGTLTVKIAVIASVLSIVSLYLPWFTYGGQSQSVMEAIEADPDFFAGAMPILLVAALVTIVLFLTNHPKLSLIGPAVMAFMFMALKVAGDERNLNSGIGTYLYLVVIIVCIVCAFATKKHR